MKRVLLFAAVVLLVSPLVLGSPIGNMTVFLLAQTNPPSYSFADLPAGWAWDNAKIQGELIPIAPNADLAQNDPNLWLVPCGLCSRTAATNDWVKEVRVVAVEGTVPDGVLVRVTQDPGTKKSTSWYLETWAVPGPWYIVVDAVGQPGRNGQEKTKRYTVAGAGYVPDEYVPLLW
jgi:hypothetical protein